MQTKQALQEKRAQIAKFSKLIQSGSHLLALRSDGTVLSHGDSLDGRAAVSDWYGIEEVSCATYHSVGRRFDGSVVTTTFMPKDENAKKFDNFGQFEVQTFNQPCKTIAGAMQFTFGLTNSGRVQATRYHDPHNMPDPDDTYNKVTAWGRIKDIETGSSMNTIIGLREDGTVVAAGSNYYGMCNVQGWSNIEKIFATTSTAIGIKTDGSVVATKYIVPTSSYTPDEMKHYYGQCEVSSWRNIVDIAQSTRHTVGLRDDGTVVATKFLKHPNVAYHGQCEVSDWTDIVAISANDNLTVGLRYDGTVVAVGDNRKGQCNVSEWKDIVAIHAAFGFTLGIKSDGTIVSTKKDFSLFGIRSDGSEMNGDEEGDFKLFGDVSTFDAEREEAKRKLASGEAQKERKAATDLMLESADDFYDDYDLDDYLEDDTFKGYEDTYKPDSTPSSSHKNKDNGGCLGFFRKIYLAIILICLVIGVIYFPIKLFILDQTVNGMQFERENGAYVLIGFDEDANISNLVIPSTIKNKPVVAINAYAFKDCDELISITIPDSVKIIEQQAFYNCKNLKTVKIGTGLETIDDKAFYDCESLTEINLPASLKKIGYLAFDGCDNIQQPINYGGTREQWNEVDGKNSGNAFVYKVICKDEIIE